MVKAAPSTQGSQKALWRALSNPLRRRILDHLRRGPRNTGQIARAFPKLSRYAVMQHLGVLADAKLVLIERRGRERWNYLNAIPLHAMYRRWVHRFADELADSADQLKQLSERAERNHPMPMDAPGDPLRVVELKLEYTINASPARVWQIMTQRIDDWWKRANFYIRPESAVFHIELKAGGRMWEEYADGGALLWWTVNEIVPGKVLGFIGMYGSGPEGFKQEQNRIELVASERGGCIVKLRQTLVGLLRDAEEATKPYVGGWNQLFQDGLKPLAEESGAGA